jgi:hypothetical protein
MIITFVIDFWRETCTVNRQSLITNYKRENLCQTVSLASSFCFMEPGHSYDMFCFQVLQGCDEVKRSYCWEGETSESRHFKG